MKSTTALVFFGLILVEVSSLKISTRIMNGLQASRRQFPYQVGLDLYTADGTFLCGGSIISNEWILTAAHCINPVKTFIDVNVGAWNISNSQEKGQQRIPITKESAIMHENYNSSNFKNDIALIKLPVKIEFNEYIQPINIPKISTSYPTYVNEIAVASGWGRTNDDGELPDILQYIEEPVLENIICGEKYFGLVTDTNICLSAPGGRTACSGDSGGPLELPGDKPLLIGTTSFGYTICKTGAPAVFTRITSYLDWIKEHTGIVGH